MSQIAELTVVNGAAVNEVSRALFPSPIKPAVAGRNAVAPRRSLVRGGVGDSSCATTISANTSSQSVPVTISGASEDDAFSPRLMRAFWVTVVVGFTVVAWQSGLLAQVFLAAQTLLPWGR